MIYNIDILTHGTTMPGAGPCYCVAPYFTSAIYLVNPGDTVNFGSVTIYSFAGDPTPDEYLYYEMYGFTPYYVQFTAGVSYDPSTLPYSVFSVPETEPSSISVDLAYVIPVGDYSIQVGWLGDFDYVAPVPEPSTWAMLLIGFAAIGFAGYRKRRQYTFTPSAVI